MRTLILATAITLLPALLHAQWLPGQSPLERSARQQAFGKKKAVAGAIYRVTAGNAPAKGPADAPVEIIEYSDFQCPYCKRAQETLKKLFEKFPGQIRMVFKNHPLKMHKHAQLAAEASLAANAQGKFWEMHDLLFNFHDALEREDLYAYAESIGLDMQQFDHDLSTGRFTEQVRKESLEAVAIGATGVPAVFVNGLYIKGSKPLNVYEKAVLAALGEIAEAAEEEENEEDEDCADDEVANEEELVRK